MKNIAEFQLIFSIDGDKIMSNAFSNIHSQIILDYRSSKETKSELRRLGYTVIETKKINDLYAAVDGHTDMQLFKAGNCLIVAQEAFDYYRNIFGNKVICGSKKLSDKYPYDILYNAACVGDLIICNKAYIAKEIIEFATQTQKKLLNVKQGYAKCSTAIIGKNAVVTADKGIAQVCIDNNIDVLEIEPGYIELKNMDYGFIGGCCGMLDKKTIAFNGELKNHPQHEEICSFCKNHKVDIIELKKGPLVDIGSIIVV